MLTRRSGLIAAAAAMVLAASAAPVIAQVAPPKLGGTAHNFFKLRKRVAIPAYNVTFIMQQQGTAAASIGARARLNLVLEGVDDATMQTLADEAHADLVARFKAAGFDVLPDEEARALTAGMATAPNNRDIVSVGPGVTIGKSVKIGWVSMGARAAPLLLAYHNPAAPTGPMGLQIIGANGKLGGAARAADATAVVPVLMVDFADMEAKTGSGFLGGGTAGIDANLRFGLRAFSTTTFVVSAYDKGAPFNGGWQLQKDLAIPGPFATVVEGGAGVRTGTMSAVPDSNYVMRDRARGDAVVVNLPVWSDLVRQAYKAYNTAIVEAAIKARG